METCLFCHENFRHKHNNINGKDCFKCYTCCCLPKKIHMKNSESNFDQCQKNLPENFAFVEELQKENKKLRKENQLLVEQQADILSEFDSFKYSYELMECQLQEMEEKLQTTTTTLDSCQQELETVKQLCRENIGHAAEYETHSITVNEKQQNQLLQTANPLKLLHVNDEQLKVLKDACSFFRKNQVTEYETLLCSQKQIESKLKIQKKATNILDTLGKELEHLQRKQPLEKQNTTFATKEKGSSGLCPRNKPVVVIY